MSNFCILTFALLFLALIMCCFGIMYALFAILGIMQRFENHSENYSSEIDDIIDNKSNPF